MNPADAMFTGKRRLARREDAGSEERALAGSAVPIAPRQPTERGTLITVPSIPLPHPPYLTTATISLARRAT